MSSIQTSVQTDTVTLSWKAHIVRPGASIRLERALVSDRKQETQYVYVSTFHPQPSSSELRTYSFQDLNLTPGHYFYRLVYSDGSLTHVFEPEEVIVRPILFEQIQANYEEDTIILDWNTVTELNQVRFHVERAKIECRFLPSPDEISFVYRGVLNAHGPAFRNQTYRFIDPVIDSGCYRYRINVEDLQADDSRYILTETEVHVPIPDQFAILSNFPNPFKEQTQIVVDLVYPFRISGGQARVEVYDVAGRLVARLHEGYLPPGRQQFSFFSSGLASGVYFVRFTLEHYRAQQVEGERIQIHPLVVIE